MGDRHRGVATGLEPVLHLRLDQAGASDEQIQRVHAILLREKPEPTEDYSPLPLMLLGLMSACILFSAIYLGRYSGGFDPMVYDERILPGMQDERQAAYLDNFFTKELLPILTPIALA